jgi:hypothetical protein
MNQKARKWPKRRRIEVFLKLDADDDDEDDGEPENKKPVPNGRDEEDSTDSFERLLNMM